MKSRLFFRENGHVVTTRRGWFHQVGWPLLACMFLVGVLGVGEMFDSNAEANHQVEVAHAFEQGRAQARQDLLPTVKSAYEQGMRDAVAAHQKKPEGVQLAQACMAWWYAPEVNKTSLRRKVCGNAQ